MGYLKDWIDLLPIKKHRLPLYGFPQGSGYHIFSQILNFKDLWDRMSKSSVLFILSDLWRQDFINFWFLKNIQHSIFGINFVGLQEMNYQGFTMYKDKRFSSYSSQLKYILNPNEYVLYDEPVHSMTDGKVIAIVNKYNDRLIREPLRKSYEVNDTPEELYGNHVIIRSNGIDYFYGGLRRNSMVRLRIGDDIRIGDVIGSVGCQGNQGVFPYLHVHASINASYITLIKSPPFSLFSEITVPILKFEHFYETPLLNSIRNTPEAMDRFLVRDIKYIYNSGTILYPGSLIRKI